MNILVHSWWFSKYRGSEFSVAYNFAFNMAKRHRLYFLVESCSYDWGDTKELKDTHIDNCDFIVVPLKSKFWQSFVELMCHTPFGGWSSYILFHLWEKAVYKYLKKVDFIKKNKIDIVHFAAPVGYREPGYLWKLAKENNTPYVWGPFGGMQRINRVFLKRCSFKQKSIWQIKNCINYLQFNFSRRVAKAFKSADILISGTKIQQKMVNRKLKTNKCLYLAENGIDINKLKECSDAYIQKKYSNINRIKIIWIGKNDARKNVIFLLEALSTLKQKDLEHIECLFIGEGCMKLKESVEKLKLQDCVKLKEYVPRWEVQKMIQEVHLLAITSIMEGIPTTIWEAMEHCVPVITLDHCGMADVVKDGKTGLKVPIGAYQKMTVDFANAIKRFIEQPELLKEYAQNTKIVAQEYTQQKRMDFFDECYKKAINIRGGGVLTPCYKRAA